MMKISNFKIQILVAICCLLMSSACASIGRNRIHVSSHTQNDHFTTAAIHFDFNKTLIRETDKTILNNVANTLRTSPKAVAVLEGHADEVGQPLYNEVLGENRARAVRVYLRDKGIDPRRVTLVSKGANEPVVAGSTPAARARNRRVEIFIALAEQDHRSAPAAQDTMEGL